jgi:hypothetical protein
MFWFPRQPTLDPLKDHRFVFVASHCPDLAIPDGKIGLS